MNPLVSVIIPSYNAGPYLRQAVDSVLAQTWTNLEVLVVDDGSDDSSPLDLLDITDPRLRTIHQQHAGKSAAMNRAIAQARGDFYAIQDADDLSRPDRIEAQARCLLEHAQVAGVLCGHDLLIDGQVTALPRVYKDMAQCAADIAAMRLPAHDPTALYRLSMVRDVTYDTDLPRCQGWDYTLRVGERWPLLVHGQWMYLYRIGHKPPVQAGGDYQLMRFKALARREVRP